MRVAALILGILGGLSGLSLSALGSFVFIAGSGGRGGGAESLLLFGIPGASVLGGGVAMSAPGLGALLMFASAGAWYWIGSQFGYGINFVTGAPMILSGMGALLALAAAAQTTNDTASNADGGRLRITPEPSVIPPFSVEPAPRSSSPYDKAKWNALLKYDPEIAIVTDKLRPLGQKWLDEFAASYLAINDKNYLPSIVQKLIRDARSEYERNQWAHDKQDEIQHSSPQRL